MITTAAQAKVITAVKRSPAGPEANEQHSSFHLCTGGLCHLQIAGEIRFSFPPDRQPETGQLMPFISGWGEIWDFFGVCVCDVGNYTEKVDELQRKMSKSDTTFVI